MQPEVEGYFVPLFNDLVLDTAQLLSADPELHAYFIGPKHRGAGAIGLDQEDADAIERILARHRLGEILAVDREQLAASHEAWVHVTILRDDVDPPLFAGFGPYPRAGILTWGNSD